MRYSLASHIENRLLDGQGGIRFLASKAYLMKFLLSASLNPADRSHHPERSRPRIQ